MEKQHDSELPARLSSDLRGLLENIENEYTFRISDGIIEANKSYVRLKNAEIQVSRDGIFLVKADIDDCITSW